MCANSEGSGDTAQMHRLAWAFAGRLCDKNLNLMSWLFWIIRPMLSDRFSNSCLIKNHFFRNTAVYCKNFSKKMDNWKNGCNHLKIWTIWFYHRVMGPKAASRMANCVDLDYLKQSDLCLHCLLRPVYAKTYDHYGTVNILKIRTVKS